MNGYFFQIIYLPKAMQFESHDQVSALISLGKQLIHRFVNEGKNF